MLENELLELCSLQSPQEDQLERIEAILQSGIDPNCTNKSGQTPLLLCLARQDEQVNLKCLKILLLGNQTRNSSSTPWQKVINLNLNDHRGMNAYHAIREKLAKGHTTITEVLEMLIDGGIDLKLKDQFKRTALPRMAPTSS